MKRTYSFIAFSSLALLTILIIQINWVFQMATIKEKLFSEKADIVLAKTVAALYNDQETCQKIEASAAENTTGTITQLGVVESQVIDSLFAHYMAFYDFNIDYSFVISKPPNKAPDYLNYIYNKNLEGFTPKNQLELKLIFADKKQFIWAEMSPLFITSILLILLVLILFWCTTLSLLKEKKISEHTTDFLNNMTHEFKTPITNIALASKMLGKSSKLSKKEKIQHYAEIISEENQKLALQVEQMLGMSALERGEIPLQKTTLDMHSIIQQIIKSAQLQVEAKQGNLNLQLTAKQAVILGDKIHLSNMLCSLIDNAIKYSAQKIDLSIQTTSTAQHLSIIVADKGIGIDSKYQKKVFDKFFRVPTGNVHNVKGFGLGLTYIQSIVKRHNGRITLKSQKGQGTVFCITLPLHPIQVNQLQSPVIVN